MTTETKRGNDNEKEARILKMAADAFDLESLAKAKDEAGLGDLRKKDMNSQQQARLARIEYDHYHGPKDEKGKDVRYKTGGQRTVNGKTVDATMTRSQLFRVYLGLLIQRMNCIFILSKKLSGSKARAANAEYRFVGPDGKEKSINKTDLKKLRTDLEKAIRDIYHHFRFARRRAPSSDRLASGAGDYAPVYVTEALAKYVNDEELGPLVDAPKAEGWITEINGASAEQKVAIAQRVLKALNEDNSRFQDGLVGLKVADSLSLKNTINNVFYLAKYVNYDLVDQSDKKRSQLTDAMRKDLSGVIESINKKKATEGKKAIAQGGYLQQFEFKTIVSAATEPLSDEDYKDRVDTPSDKQKAERALVEVHKNLWRTVRNALNPPKGKGKVATATTAPTARTAPTTIGRTTARR